MTDDTYGFEEPFQKAIVALSLQDPAFIKQYHDVVLPGYFDFDYLSSIVRIARELTDRFDSVPTKVSVVEEVKQFCAQFNLDSGDREFILGQLEELYTIDTVDAAYIRDRVVQFGQHQAIRGAVLKIVGMLQKPRTQSEDMYEKARDMLEAALRVGLDSRDLGLDFCTSLNDIPDMMAASVAGVHRKIPTGFETIDKHTLGGPGRGEVWVVVALPGRGKTTFLVNVGANALKRGFEVVHITIGDLKQVDIAARYAARMTRSTMYEIATKSEGYFKKAGIVAKYKPRLRVKYYPSDTATIGHIRSYLARLRAVEGVSPGILIIDYPEELRMPVKDNLYLSGGANYSAIGSIADEFDCLVWTASQPKSITMLNKAQADAEYIIQGQEMAESGKKFQKVDGMLSWNMTYEEELLGHGRLWIDKTRRAKSFYLVHCDVALEKMLIREGRPPEERVEGHLANLVS